MPKNVSFKLHTALCYIRSREKIVQCPSSTRLFLLRQFIDGIHQARLFLGCLYVIGRVSILYWNFHFSRSKQMWLILSFMEFSKSQPLKIHILLSVPFFTSWQKVPTPAISFIGFIITYMSMMKTNGCLTLSKRLKNQTPIQIKKPQFLWKLTKCFALFMCLQEWTRLKSQHWLDIFLSKNRFINLLFALKYFLNKYDSCLLFFIRHILK